MKNTPYLPPMYAADGMVRIPESTLRQLVDSNMELLEALEECLLNFAHALGDNQQAAIARSRAAIAKATS